MADFSVGNKNRYDGSKQKTARATMGNKQVINKTLKQKFSMGYDLNRMVYDYEYHSTLENVYMIFMIDIDGTLCYTEGSNHHELIS